MIAISGCADSPPPGASSGSVDQGSSEDSGRRERPTADQGTPDQGTSDVADLALDSFDAGTDSVGTEDIGTAEVDSGSVDESAPDLPDATTDTDDGQADTVEVPEDVEDEWRAPDIEACVETTASAGQSSAPADIIWIIDSSESMDNEIDIVRENINAFAAIIGGSGIDYRVTMIAADRRINGGFFGRSYHGVCVPPPLSAADRCPDVDNPGTYLHVREGVYSTDSLEVLIDNYSEYQSFLRPAAKLHIVEVSDDETWRSPRWLRDQIGSLAPPGFPEDFKFHSIVQTPGDRCGDADGDRYINLSTATGGAVASICESNWDPIFEAIQEIVIEDSALPCYYAMPEVPDDTEIVLDEVNVYFTPAEGERTLLPNVDSADACGELNGWYYDDPIVPSGITLCAAACGDEVDGELEIAFGCATIKT